MRLCFCASVLHILLPVNVCVCCSSIPVDVFILVDVAVHVPTLRVWDENKFRYSATAA